MAATKRRATPKRPVPRPRPKARPPVRAPDTRKVTPAADPRHSMYVSAPAPPPKAPRSPTTAPVVEPPPVAPTPIKGPRLEGVALWSARGVGGLLVLLLIALPLVDSVITGIRAFDDPTTTRATATTTWLNLALIIVLFAALPVLYVALVRPGVPLARHLGFVVSDRAPLQLLLGFALGGALVVSLGLAVWAWSAITGYDPSSQESAVTGLSELVREHPEFLFAIPAVAAIAEELFFRGFLLPRIGIIASSLAFGLAHATYGTWLELVAPFVAGLVFALLTRRSKALWVAIGAHFSFNFIQLLFAYSMGGS